MQKVDIFSREISLWSDALFTPATVHRTCTIADFIRWGNTPHYAAKVEQARTIKRVQLDALSRGDIAAAKEAKEHYTRLKRSVPVAMPQGVNPDHNNDGFTSYTDIVCLDIDAPADGATFDIDAVKAKIIQSKFVAYCGMSIGGCGLWVLIPIADHANHVAHWRAMCEDFKTIGVTIDKGTSNIGRLRFMSSDPHAYINHEAVVYQKTLNEPKQAPGTMTMLAPPPNAGQVTQWVYTCRDDIVKRGIDITPTYDDWLMLAGSLVHYMGDGDNSRKLFHTIAQVHGDGYNWQENETLFTGMSDETAPRKYGIGSFFRLCHQHGVTVPHGAIRQYMSDVTPPMRLTPKPPTPEQLARHNRHHPVPATSTPPPMPMTPGEAESMRQHATDIADGVAIVDSMKAADPAFAKICDDLQLDFCGIDNWHMTDAQFDNFFKQRHEPPF